MKRLWLLAIVLLFCMSQSALAIRPVAIGDVVHKGGGVYDVRAYGATGDGSTDDYAAINNAATAAAGNTLEFKSGTYKIGTNISLDEDVLFYNGAMLSIDTGVTVTFTGTVDAGIYQIFPGVGTAAFSAGVCDAVYPQWWGAVGDGSNDDTSAFDSAMTAAQAVGKLKIPAGTYKISSPLQNFPTGPFASAKDGYIIEGCGTETVINYTGTTGYAFEIDSNTATDVFVPIGVTIRDLHIELGSITSADVGGGILSVGSFTNIERITTTNADNATGIHARARNTTTTEASMTNDTNRDFTTTGAGASEKYGIKFTSPTRAATFKSAVVRLGITGAPAGTVHGELWTDVAGSPGAQIAGGDSDTVTINTISSAADGENVTLEFGDSGGRPVVSGSTAYWLVISTTGYTYTDTTTELRLRVEAGGGAANSFGIYDFGGASWSTSADGANHTMNCRYGQPLQVNVNGCGIQSTTAIGRAFWLEDNSFMNIVNSYADAVEGVRSEYGYLEWHNLYLFTSGVPVYSTGWSKLFGGVIEGPAAYPSYFGGKGHTHRLVGVTNGAAPVTWESGTWLTQEQCDKDFWWSDFADVVPDQWRYKIIPAQADSDQWDTYDATLAADVTALNGYTTELNAQHEYIQVIWGATKIYAFLPRGTYKATMWMKDTAQVANDMIVRSDFYDGAWNTDFENTFTLTGDYKPYTLLMRLDATQNADITYQKRIWLRKATATANTISVSHVVIEYIGPDIVGDQNVIATSTTHSNADQSRDSHVEFWGSKADGYQSALGQITGQHDGTGDDYKGEIDLKLNTGGETYDTLSSIKKFSTTIDTFVDGDTTPPISGGNLFATGNTGGTTITMFDGGISGKSIAVLFGDANTTLDFSGTNIKGNGGVDWTAASGDVLYATFDGTDWCSTISNPDGVGGLWREVATDNFFGPATAGAALTTGDYNTAGGVSANASLTTGSNISSYGYKAAESLTYGAHDIFIGSHAGNESTVSGGYNISAGYKSLNKLAYVNPFDAAYNIGIGNYAGYNITVGHDNTFVGGDRPGIMLTEGDYNSGFGTYALADETTGKWNTALGIYALENARTGDGNTSVGAYSLQGTAGVGTGVNGDYNSALGYAAGWKMEGESNRNVFIGYKAGPTAASNFDDKLYIANAGGETPLIHGDFATPVVTINGDLTVTGAFSGGPSSGGTFTSSTDGGTVLSSANTHADLTVATYLLDLDFTDDGDAEGNFLRCRDNSAGDVKFLLGANGFVDINPNGITGTGNRVFEITPADALPASAHLTFMRLVGDNLDPSGASTRIRGLAIKFDDVGLGNDPEINAIRVVMPASYTGEQDMAAFYASGNGHTIKFMDNDEGRNSIWTDGEIEQDYTAANTANTTFSPIQVNLDVDDLAATSEVHVLGVSATGTTTGDYCIIGANGSVCVLHQHTGAFATPSQTEYAARWPNAGAWTDGIDGIQCFVAVSDEIFIGSATKFSQLEVLLTTPSSKEIKPEFYFYDTSPVWVQFIPGDASGGFTSDGIISWDSAALTNWNGAYDPGVGDGSTGYYIKIKRTRVVVATPPTPATVKILEPTLYSWDEDGDLDIDDLQVNGTTIDVPSTTQVIDAVGDAILADATLVILNPDADYTLTSTPHMADGTTGQIIYISCANAEAFTVTLQDEDTLAGSNFQLAGDNVEVTGQVVLVFQFDGTDWIEVTGPSITNIKRLTIVNELTIPTDDNPTTDDDGELALDTNDDALEVYSGGKSSLIPTLDDKEALIFAPDGVNDQIPLFHVDADRYPHGIKLVNVQITIPSDGAYSMVFEEWAGDPPAAQNDIETVTTGAGDSYMEVLLGNIDDSDIDADDYIFLDIPATDIDWIHVKVIFYVKEGN